MARIPRQSGWLSLPEAAEAVPISLPALRYLVSRLGLMLGAVQDDWGDTFVPAHRLGDLRRVAAWRSQGFGVHEIRARLAEAARPSDPAAGQDDQGPTAPSPYPEPSVTRGRTEPAAEHSLPFPFRPNGRSGSSRRGHHSARPHELPFPASDLKEELEALRKENQELRRRLDDLIAWLREKEPKTAPGPSSPPSQRPYHPSRIESRETFPVLAAAAGGLPPEPSEGPVMTRTPSGNVRPARVRSWNPPVLRRRS